MPPSRDGRKRRIYVLTDAEDNVNLCVLGESTSHEQYLETRRGHRF